MTAQSSLDWTPQAVTDPCPDCGKQRDTFACKIKHQGQPVIGWGRASQQ